MRRWIRAHGPALSFVVASALIGTGAAEGETAGEKAPARLLVVTVAKAYRHESIPVLSQRIVQLGQQSGLFVVDRADTDEELLRITTPEALETCDGVVFANTSEDLPLADREAFLAWVEAGGAVVGIHGAATAKGWPDFIALLGGEFDSHGEQATVEVRVDDPGHPATEGLDPTFEVHDEIYLYKSFDRDRVRMLLSMDRHPNTGEPGFFPWAWTREQGKGRVFYTGAGHRDDVVQSGWFGRHLLGGIRWALRR